MAQTNETLDHLARLDLRGRPFLHEQGNTVTRGFVQSLEQDHSSWTLRVEQVEYLDKTNGSWRPDVPEDHYGGHRDHLSIERQKSEDPAESDNGIEMAGYGMTIFIGHNSDDPWADNDWPELDTDWLSPGPMTA